MGEKKKKKKKKEEAVSDNAYLFLHDQRLVVDVLQNLYHVRLKDHAPHTDLVNDVVHLLDVKDEIELAHVLKPLVQRFHKDLNQVKDAKLGL